MSNQRTILPNGISIEGIDFPSLKELISQPRSTEVHALKKDQIQTLYRIAYQALKKNQFAEAIQLFHLLICHDPNNPAGYLGTALASLRSAKYQLGLDSCFIGFQFFPEEPDFPYIAGLIQIKLGRTEAARLGFEEALRVCERLPLRVKSRNAAQAELDQLNLTTKEAMA